MPFPATVELCSALVVGRHKEKRWGIIFKCMTAPVVHLDILCNVGSDADLMGWPGEIHLTARLPKDSVLLRPPLQPLILVVCGNGKFAQ